MWGLLKSSAWGLLKSSAWGQLKLFEEQICFCDDLEHLLHRLFSFLQVRDWVVKLKVHVAHAHFTPRLKLTEFLCVCVILN